TPAALLVVEAGEGVQDRVEVRGHVQAEHVHVVADVADHGHEIGCSDDALDEAGPADSAGEDDDVHGAIPAESALSTACVRGPQRSCRRSRSARVSTSSARFGTATATVSTGSARKRLALSGPYNGLKMSPAESPSAFVVPSSASTSARPWAGIAASSARRSAGTAQGTSALTTSTCPAPASSSAAATAAPCPPPGSATASAPASAASVGPSASPVTTSVRPTTTVAASTSASIARDRSRRVPRDASRRVFPSVPANGTTTVVIGAA